jgi:hypothetical protein
MIKGVKAAVAAAFVVGSVVGAQAQATVAEMPGVSTWNFEAPCWFCSDDTIVGTATLTLQNYVKGSAITTDNFVGFTYTSADLGTLTISPQDSISYIAGSMPGSQPFPQWANFEVDWTAASGGSHFFASQGGDGVSWNVDNVDGGIPFTWSSPAPEPASWALMVGGFGLAGAALRRRRTVVRFA